MLKHKPTKLKQNRIISNSPKDSNFQEKLAKKKLKKKETKSNRKKFFLFAFIQRKLRRLGKLPRYSYKKRKKRKIEGPFIGEPKKLSYGKFLKSKVKSFKKSKVKSFKNQQSTKIGKAKFYIGKPASINSKAKSSSGKPVTENSKNKFLKGKPVIKDSKDKSSSYSKDKSSYSKDKSSSGKPVTENSKNKFFKGKPVTGNSKKKFFKGKPVIKKGGVKPLPLCGVIHLLCNKRSIFCTLSDTKGRIKASVSTGIVKERGKGVRGKKRKSYYYVPKTAQLLINHMFKLPYRSFVVKIRGNAFKKKKRILIKYFLKIRKFFYIQLFNITLKSHNGCRLPKLRRK